MMEKEKGTTYLTKKYPPRSFVLKNGMFDHTFYNSRMIMLNKLSKIFSSSPFNDTQVEMIITEITAQAIEAQAWIPVDCMNEDQFLPAVVEKLINAEFCKKWSDSDGTIFLEPTEKLAIFVNERLKKNKI